MKSIATSVAGASMQKQRSAPSAEWDNPTWHPVTTGNKELITNGWLPSSSAGFLEYLEYTGFTQVIQVQESWCSSLLAAAESGGLLILLWSSLVTSGIAMEIISGYARSNKFISFVALYFGISIVLQMAFSVNIMIPCLWKTLFHTECPGCGLTTALISLLRFDIAGAYSANPLIFIVLPSVIFYIIKDFRRYASETHL